MTRPVDIAAIPTCRLSEYIASTRHEISLLSRRIVAVEDTRYTPLTLNGLALLKSEREVLQLFLVTLLTEVQRRQQNVRQDEERKPAGASGENV